MSVEPSEAYLPWVHMDRHFSNVPDISLVDLDREKCRDLLIEVGVPAERVAASDIFIRPDYKLAYSSDERRAMKARDPDYDDISAGCELNDRGGVKITIVYGTHYGVDALLRHEAVHAAKMLADLERRQIASAGALISLLGGAVVGRAVYLAELVERIPISSTLGFSLSALMAALAGGTTAAWMRKHPEILGKSSEEEDKAEEMSADKAMKDAELKEKFRGIITVGRGKKG